jgi:hypothetical protein
MFMIRQANLFTIGQAPDGGLCVMLMPPPDYSHRIMQPSVLYDGGAHAILWRNPDEAIILDYIPEQMRSKMQGAAVLAVAEFDTKQRDIRTPYLAKIAKVEKMPDLDILTEEELRAELRKVA